MSQRYLPRTHSGVGAPPDGPSAITSPALQTVARGTFMDFDFQAGAVYALGLTFSDHIRETGESAVAPVAFRKHCQPQPAQTVASTPSAAALQAAIAANDAELAKCFPALPALLDYEVEIGIALLQPVSLQQLQQEDCQVEFALFVANDLTARSVQIAGEAGCDKLALWSAAKSFAGFLPVGPRLWRPFQPDLARFPDLLLQTFVNGQLRQSAHSSSIIYSPRQLLSAAAAVAPDGQLQQYDLILCGTPAGIGLSIPAWKRRLVSLLPPHWRVRAALRANRHNPRLLQPGDQVRCCAGWLGQSDVSIF